MPECGGVGGALDAAEFGRADGGQQRDHDDQRGREQDDSERGHGKLPSDYGLLMWLTVSEEVFAGVRR